MSSEITGFGVNVDLNHYSKEEINKITIYLKKLKVSWVRLEICYIKYSYKQKIDQMEYFCKLCIKNKIKIVGLLTHFVPASLKNVFFPHHSYTPVSSNISNYLKFVEIVSDKLKKYIIYWEVWNEQNTKRFWTNDPSPKEYVVFLKKVRETLLKNNSSNKIIFGGIAGNDITPLYHLPENIVHFKGFLEKCIDLGALNYADLFGFHPYTSSCYISFKNADQILKDIKSRILETLKKYKDQKLIITEIGVSPVLNFRVKSKDIAKIYKKLIIFAQKKEIPICIYALSDNSPNHYSLLNPDRDFGFLDNKLNEKELFLKFVK